MQITRSGLISMTRTAKKYIKFYNFNEKNKNILKIPSYDSKPLETKYYQNGTKRNTYLNQN